MKKIKLINVLIFAAIFSVNLKAQVTESNIVACGIAIKAEIEAINNLTQEQYCAFKSIAENKNLSTLEKNNTLSSNQSISHLISIQQNTIQQLVANNFISIYNDPERKQAFLDWVENNVVGSIVNGGNGKCDQYNREARTIGEDWLACTLLTGLDTPVSLWCHYVAMRDLRNLDLEYPECANGKNGGIAFKPWIIDDNAIDCTKKNNEK
jgi:hypothetical protein